jgi:urease gamma subunit
MTRDIYASGRIQLFRVAFNSSVPDKGNLNKGISRSNNYEMGPTRQLVSRAALSGNSSPAQRRRQDGEAEEVQSTPLPPYEPPLCPLSVAQKRALDGLRLNYDDAKYKKHISASKKNITSAVGESNDRLTAHRDKVRRTEARISKKEREKTEAEMEEEQYTKTMDKKVLDLTAKGEKAMRDLIDYSEELAMQESIMTGVSESIAAAPAPCPAPGRRTRSGSHGGEGDEEVAAGEAPVADAAILSPVELLKKGKEDYTTAYTSRSMRDR